jgi:hypothetical protein
MKKNKKSRNWMKILSILALIVFTLTAALCIVSLYHNDLWPGIGYGLALTSFLLFMAVFAPGEEKRKRRDGTEYIIHWRPF